MLRRNQLVFLRSSLRQGLQSNLRLGTQSVRFFNNDEVDVDDFKIPPLVRTGEDLETKRARLLYQARKRGILEADLILSKFAKIYLPTMTMEQLDEFDKLLDEPDWDIFYWATRNEKRVCPERWDKTDLMDKLRLVAENREREVLRMPDL